MHASAEDDRTSLSLSVFCSLNFYSLQTDHAGEASSEEHQELQNNGSQWELEGSQKNVCGKVRWPTKAGRECYHYLCLILCPHTFTVHRLGPQQAEQLLSQSLCAWEQERKAEVVDTVMSLSSTYPRWLCILMLITHPSFPSLALSDDLPHSWENGQDNEKNRGGKLSMLWLQCCSLSSDGPLSKSIYLS